MDRKEAKLLGRNTYLTGVPCKNGHVAYRYTMSGTCSQCINGTRKTGDSETFLNRANELRITALLTYNEGLKNITKYYEEALANADKLETRAAELRAMDDENKRKEAQYATERDRILSAKNEELERKQAIKRMVKQNVFIHPDDVFEAKTYLLERAQSVCPHVTMDDVNYKRKVQGGVLHEIRCFSEHRDEIIEATNKAYTARNVVAVPEPTPQS